MISGLVHKALATEGIEPTGVEEVRIIQILRSSNTAAGAAENRTRVPAIARQQWDGRRVVQPGRWTSGGSAFQQNNRHKSAAGRVRAASGCEIGRHQGAGVGAVAEQRCFEVTFAPLNRKPVIS